VLTIVFVVFMIFVGRRLLTLLARRYEATGQLTADQVAVVLTGVLASAFVTEWIGIHAIFGGFIFGAIMPKHSRMTHELTDKVEDFTVVVLLPVFFCVAGLRTNLFALNSPELLGWLALILIVAIAGKLIGCGVAARLNGFSTHDSIVMGTLMNTRGLTELVILSVGQSLGVLSDRTFAMMVIMALVTTFMAAPIINRLIPRRRMVHMLSGGDPAPVAMRVLVALGNPLNAPHLVDAAMRMTGARRPAELLLVRLIPTARAPEFRTGLQEEESQVDASVEAMRALVRETDDNTALEEALVENLQREDLNPLEEAAAYQQLIEDFSLTHEQVAARVGRSRASISNTLRLLQLPPSIQRSVREKQLSMGHARALLGTPDRAFQEALAKRIVKDDLSVRQVEDAIRARNDGAEKKSDAGVPGRMRPAGLAELEEMLGDHLDTRAKIRLGAGGKGTLTIDFAGLDDLERIYRAITGGQLPHAESA
jgi:ParB-like chromosome segregation protein Spo0J